MDALEYTRPSPILGCKVKILDGNALAATEHRLKELRLLRAGALPGKAVVVYEPARNLVEKTGAEVFATSCSNCRLTLDDGQQHFHWGKKVHSLVEMVAENLEG